MFYNFLQLINSELWNNYSSEAFAAFLAFGIVFAIIFSLAIYIYFALAWSTIARKLKYKNHWLAWIPLAQLALIPILAKKKWTWVFMFLVPIANFVFFIIWMWKIYERRKYPGALSLIYIGQVIPLVHLAASIANLVILGIVAWNNKK